MKRITFLLFVILYSTFESCISTSHANAYSAGNHFHRYRSRAKFRNISSPNFSNQNSKYGLINSNIKSTQSGTLTAGEVSDFAKFHLWKKYIQNEFLGSQEKLGINLESRYVVQVKTSNGSAIPFAKVTLKQNENIIWESITDNTGKAELWNWKETNSNPYAEILYNNKSYQLSELKKYENGINTQIINETCPNPINKIQLSFVIDATSSMDDEIAYLKADIGYILNDIAQKTQKETSFSSVIYKAIENTDMLSSFDFTKDIKQLNNYIEKQKADGGGSEAVAEGLEEAIKKLSWKDDAYKVLFILLDEPPAFYEKEIVSLKASMKLAAQKGIRVVPIICSGYDKNMEYLMRCFALATNGTYLFLTDDSGIGDTHMKPTTDEYKVFILKDLMTNVLLRFTDFKCSYTVSDSFYLDDSHVKSLFTNTMETSTDTIEKKEEIKVEFSTKLYPNPGESIINLEFSTSFVGSIFILDNTGKTILQKTINNSSIQIDINFLTNGIYYIYIENEKYKHVEKFVKV